MIALQKLFNSFVIARMITMGLFNNNIKQQNYSNAINNHSSHSLLLEWWLWINKDVACLWLIDANVSWGKMTHELIIILSSELISLSNGNTYYQVAIKWLITTCIPTRGKLILKTTILCFDWSEWPSSYFWKWR